MSSGSENSHKQAADAAPPKELRVWSQWGRRGRYIARTSTPPYNTKLLRDDTFASCYVCSRCFSLRTGYYSATARMTDGCRRVQGRAGLGGPGRGFCLVSRSQQKEPRQKSIKVLSENLHSSPAYKTLSPPLHLVQVLGKKVGTSKSCMEAPTDSSVRWLVASATSATLAGGNKRVCLIYVMVHTK